MLPRPRGRRRRRLVPRRRLLLRQGDGQRGRGARRPRYGKLRRARLRGRHGPAAAGGPEGPQLGIGRVPDGGVVVGRHAQVDDGEEVVQHLGVALDGAPPRPVDVVAVLAMRAVDGGACRAGAGPVVVEALGGQLVEAQGVRVLARLHEHVEVCEDVVAGFAAYPGSVRQAVSNRA